MNLFTLYAELGLKDDGYKKGIKDATSSGKNFASGLVSSVSAGTIALGNLMADAAKAAGNAIMDFGRKGLDYNRTMEDYTINFKTLLGGSSEAATQMVGALEEMAAKTPFAMEHLAGSTQTLLSFGIESEKVLPIMSMLGDISMGNSEKFASLSRAFGQISAAGKLSGEDLNQLIDQGFNPLQTIAETTGASMADLKAVMSGQKTSKEFNQLMKSAQQEVKKFGDNASEGAKMLVQMGEDGAISADLVTQVFQKVTEEGGLFYNAMEESSKTTSGMLSTLEDNWTALLGSVFTPASEFLQSTLLPNAISAVDTLQNAYNEGGLSGMLSAITTMATDMGTQLVTTLSDAGTKIVEALPGIVESVTTWVTEKKSEIMTQAETLFLGFSEALPGIATKVTEALPGILTAVTAWVVASQVSASEQGIQFFGAMVDGVTSAITGISEALPGIVTAVTTWVAENGPSLLAEGILIFQNVVQGITDAIPDVGTAFNSVFTNISQAITDNLPTLLTAGGEMLGQIVSGFVDAIPGVVVGIVQLAVQIVKTFKEINWLSLGKALIDGLLNGLTAAYETSIESIKGVFTNIWTGIKEVLGIHSPSTLAAEAGGFLVEGFSNGVTTGEKTFGEKIKSVFSNIWNGIKSIFGFGGGKSAADAENDAAEVGTSVVAGLALGIEGDNSAVTQATSLGERVLEALRVALDISSGVSNMSATIGGAVTAGVDQGARDTQITGMPTVASNVFSALVSAMSISGGVAGYFTSIGSAISEGVAKGIRDNASKISSAAKDAARNAYNAAKAELGIKSPSRVMMEVGRNYAEGFAMGISQNAGLVSNAARSVAQQAVYGSYMGDVNVTQNINAIPMSPNELAMQTQSALQMLRFA